MSSSKTPCAACKLQRRKCTPECVFAPYFPPDSPQKFQNVHQVFGASNVSKLLTDLNVAEREEAVISLAYEADARIKDPVYGCVGLIALLQQKLRYLTNEIDKANKELAFYEGAQALQPMLVPGLDPHHAGMVPLHPHQHPAAAGNIYGPSVFPYNNMTPQAMAAARGAGQIVIRDPQQQQPQELYGIYDHNQQQPPQLQQKGFMSYGGGGGVEMGSVSESGFNQPAEMSASLALNTFDNSYHSVQLQRGQGGDHRHHQQQQQNQHHHHQAPRHLQEQHLLPQQQMQHQNQLHHQLQEQLLLSSQQTQQQQQLLPPHQQLQPQPPHHHQLQEQALLPSQLPQLQPQQQHQRRHHQLQEQLFIGSQQPQRHQDQHQHHQLQLQEHQLREKMLLPPHQPQPQPQPQHQEQSKDEDGRRAGPSS